MLSLSKSIFLFSLIFLINPIFSQQPYDSSNCTSSQPQLQGYICNSKEDLDCKTYIVYRAQKNYHSITSIASLFNLTQLDLLEANHHLNEQHTDLSNLTFGQEIVIPVTCQCHGGIFHAVPSTYNFSSRDSVSSVACDVFEGLVKAQSLLQENPEGHRIVVVPIRCACPNSIQRTNGVSYLVTYPILEGDYPDLIARKFSLSEKNVRDANNLRVRDAIFPKTTILIPANNLTNVNWDIGTNFPQISPAPKATFRVISVAESTKLWNSHVFLGGGVFFAVITMVISCGIFRSIRHMNHPRRFLSLSARNSVVTSNVSQNFLDGVSKLKISIISYSLEDIRIATQDFGEAFMIRKGMYGGWIGSSYLAFERMDTEEVARNVIDILTKINHFNIVRLQGFCGGIKPYIVVEYPGNGSLEKCLSNSESKRQLTWSRRVQIAFDLAAALHYLHNSTAPHFVHHNINSTNVLLTIDWRAKLSGFSSAKPVMITCKEENEDINPNTPMNVDVYAFGIVLLELVSGKEIVKDDKIQIDSIRFLVDEKVYENLLENLRGFMDPEMDGNYEIGDAICLVFLAKSCIEKDPNHRPTMNDILIALSRIV